MSQFDRLKTQLGILDDEPSALLDLLLDDAKEAILLYTRRRPEQWLAGFNAIQREMAVIKYNRRGDEGLQSKTVGEVAVSYLGVEDYPDSVIKQLNPYRLIK